MIITWEWFVIIGFILGAVGIWIGYLISEWTTYDYLSIAIVISGLIVFLTSLILSFLLSLAQNKVEKEYHRYIEIKTQYYEALLSETPLDDAYAEGRVIFEWNKWYDENKGKLNNEWHLWGTSSYAKKMDYIEVIEN